MEKKKVACLYRVSTKQQVTDDDIPLQRNACMEFIRKHPDWSFYKEYCEKGISGFKIKAEEREVLEQLKADASENKFQIVLVFMFDRLGRIEEETPFVLKWFVDHGIEMWSVKEGQRTLDNHVDNLLNYITFWQAAGESKKTQQRTLEAKQLMREENRFQGCAAPYGYKHISTGIHNAKGREIKRLVINDEEAKVVRQIYDMYTLLGYGARRIVKKLNENNIPTKKGKVWGGTTVTGILKNPIYSGRFMYGRYKNRVYCNQSNCQITDKKYDDLVIISEQQWKDAQTIIASRVGTGKSNIPKLTKSTLLFTGNIYCGICGERMTLHYSYSHNKRKDGTVDRRRNPFYVCFGKESGRIKCSNKAYSAERIEGPVMKLVCSYMESMVIDDFREEYFKNQKDRVRKYRGKIKALENDLKILKEEILKVLKGKSSFTQELLSEQIIEKENEIVRLTSKLNERQVELESVPTWKSIFERADIEQKKLMISDLVDRIYVNENDIKLVLNFKGF